MWSGLIANIPAGWLICDGTFGTPDLRDSFIKGASADQDPGGTGGASSHTHPFTSDGHVHNLVAGDFIESGAVWSKHTSFSSDTGTTDAGSSLPPYFKLIFLMKS